MPLMSINGMEARPALPLKKPVLAAEIESLVRRVEFRDGLVYLQLTRGPAPPPMDDKAKAAAEEKKAKDAAAAEAAKAAQARAEDRVAARYIAEQKAKGVNVTPQMGPTSTPVAASPPSNRPSPKPEKQGAHSPPGTVR